MDYFVSDIYKKIQPRLTSIIDREIDEYSSFCNIFPVGSKINEERLLSTEASWLLGSTSGTTGNLKPVAIVLKYDKSKVSSCDRNFIYNLRRNQIFTPQEVVGNLFTINLFSTLHYCACDILKFCYANIVPVGDISLLRKSHFDFLFAIKLTSLFGVPATIVQFVETMVTLGVKLDIKKIVFTGEKMLTTYEKYLREILGKDLQIYGLYGMSECGFIGLSEMNNCSEYKLFSDDYFFEYDKKYGLLVTTLDANASNILIRYPTGDKGVLFVKNDNIYFNSIKRSAIDFNFMGNIISHEKILNLIHEKMPNATVQIVLSIADDRKEILDIRICSEQLNDDSLRYLKDLILDLPDIYEAIAKNKGIVKLSAIFHEDLLLSKRGKFIPVYDMRK